MSKVPMNPSRSRRAFLLLECMIAVAMFCIAVIALGRCMTACLDAQVERAREETARLALENRMVELQASPALPDEFHKSDLEGRFAGISITERRHTLNLKSEENVTMSGLSEITLSAEWTENNEKQAKTISFYLLRGS